MSLSPDILQCIPMLAGITEEQLLQLAEVFEHRMLAQGEILFEVDTPAVDFFLLTEGEVTLTEGDNIRYKLHPPAPIGELGALAGLNRNTTARANIRSEVWCTTSTKLMRFFEAHGEIALPFYQSLVHVIADKVRRDQVRMEDMRRNIIRTQKAMKKMRTFLLHKEDTPISDALHQQLEELIKNNRRANYRVSPPAILLATVKIDDAFAPVVQLSRTHITFLPEGDSSLAEGAHWTGVLSLDGPEIPISGKVITAEAGKVEVELDLLIDEYGSTLDGYLTRVQMLDFLV